MPKKKIVTTKKAVTKKTPKQTKKKASTKQTAKKTSTKKTVAARKKAVSKTKKTSSKKAEVVNLPSSAGPRLKTKAEATRQMVDMLELPMYRIAYVSAMSFLLVGIFGLGLAFVDFPTKQAANVCMAGQCEDFTNSESEPDEDNGNDPGSSDESTSQSSSEYPVVLVQSDSVPQILEISQQLSFRVENADTVQVVVTSLETGDERMVQTNRLSNQNYRFTLRPGAYESGSYRVTLELSNDLGIQIFELGEFVIQSEEIPESDSDLPTDDYDADDSLENQDNVGSETDVNADTDDVGVIITNQNGASTTNNPIPNFYAEPDVSENSGDVSRFHISRFGGVWAGDEVVEVIAPANYSNIQLYARQHSGLRAQFLGTMIKRNDVWYYTFDSNNLPNGVYEIFATANLRQGLVSSPSVVVTIGNKRPIATQDVDRVVPVGVYTPTSTLRSFYEIDTTRDKTLNQHRSVQFAQDVILDNAQDLNDLMRKYAVAKQSGDKTYIDAVERELTDKQKDLLIDLVNSPETKDNAAQIEIELTKRIEEIKSRVETFETIRSSRLGERVSEDSDNDGISDFDELNVYGTNPELADTDGDGFNDGAEVIGGYDPLNPASETVIIHELPTEVTGLTRNDVLIVAEVTPVLNNVNDSNSNSVYAEIRGTGLPNSYLTLYVFSTPVIVTVKTDADGSFVYRFDKELEDGEHEVYVAFTDNKGDILAQSEPFQFVKRAEAFSPVDSETATQAITAPTVVESSSVNSLRIVLSLSILVLGFFLLMIGINIRETSPQLMKSDDQT